MNTRTRAVLAAVCLFTLATPGVAAAEGLSRPELAKRLRAAYGAYQRDASLKVLNQRASANPADRTAVDAFLTKMPLSPLDLWQIDMEVKHYEVFIPRFIQEFHVRWVELHEALARELYGDTKVDQILTRWPVDTGEDIVGGPLRATVGTNKNVASTAVPSPTEYQGEIQIAVNHRNPNQMVAAANTWHAAGTACNNEQTQAIFYSSDGGTTWTYTCAPSNNVMALGTCSGTVFGSDPAVYWNDNNEVFLNYMLLCSSGSLQFSMVVARSADGGATWSKQGIVKNGWATGTVEDKNFYAIDNTAASPFYGRHYTCWDRSNNEKLAYSTNNGVAWTEVDLPTAPVGGIDLGCDIAVQKNGTVHVAWESLTCGVSTCTDERMWYTRSTNGGVSWSAPVQVHDHNLNGFAAGTGSKPPVADARGIGPFGAVDVDNSGGPCDGTLYATYGDFTSGGATETDIWVVRSTNGGTTWSTPVKINDDGLAGRTQFHPFLVVDQANGSVVVGWHDARNDAANRKVDYYLSRSIDCGVSFEANTKVSAISTEFNNSGITYTDENTTDNPNRNPNQYGEYLGLDVKGGKAYLAWTDSRHFYPGSSTNPQKENVGFAIVDFGPSCTPPAAPTGLTATAASATQIYLAWNAVTGAGGYKVFRATTSGGPYTQLAALAAGTTTYADATAANGSTYYYVVRATSGTCESVDSNQASATAGEFACTIDVGAGTGNCSGAITVLSSSGTQRTLQLNLAGFQRLDAFVDLCNPTGFSFHLGDSPTNDGFGGDVGTTSHDAEAHFSGTQLAAYDDDFGDLFAVEQAVIPATGCYRVQWSAMENTLLFDDDGNPADAPKVQLDSYEGFELAPYAETDSEDPSGANANLWYAGLNRSVGSAARSGTGLTKACFVLSATLTPNPATLAALCP